MKKIVCVIAVLFLLTGCSAGNGAGFSALQANSPSPDVVEVSVATPDPAATTATPVATPTPTLAPTPSPTPRLYGQLSTLTLKESIDALINLGADITNIVEYDEAAAANSAMGKLAPYTQRIDFTLNGKVDCVAEVYATVEDATARGDYYARISETAAIGAYVYRYDMAVFRVKETATLEEADAFNQLLVQVNH